MLNLYKNAIIYYIMPEIIKGRLFLGSVDDATNELWIKNNSIKLIVSVMNEPTD